jgi:hypothetical protein
MLFLVRVIQADLRTNESRFLFLRRPPIYHRSRSILTNPHSSAHIWFYFPHTALDQLPIALFKQLASQQKPFRRIILCLGFGQVDGETFGRLFIGPHTNEDMVFLTPISEHSPGERGEIIPRTLER